MSVFNTKNPQQYFPTLRLFCFLLSFGKENYKAKALGKGVVSMLYLAATMHIRNLDLRNWADQMWHSSATTVCIYRQHYSQWGIDLKHKLTIYLSNIFCFGLNLSSVIILSVISFQNVWLPLQRISQLVISRMRKWKFRQIFFRKFDLSEFSSDFNDYYMKKYLF